MTVESIVTLKVLVAPVYSYVSLAANIPLVHDIVISNMGSAPLEDLTLALSGSSELFEPWKCDLPAIGAGRSVVISNPQIVVNRVSLLVVDLAEAAHLTTVLRWHDSPLSETVHHTQVLPANQWLGGRGPPELLAAHVNPSDDLAIKVKEKANRLLLGAGTDGSLLGYDYADRSRVVQETSAIWTSMRSLRPGLAPLPTGYAQSGGIVATPNELLVPGRGNPIDAALFLAGVLECSNLNPVVILQESRVLVAVWLVRKTFETSFVDDVQRVVGAIDCGQLVVLDCARMSASMDGEFIDVLEADGQSIDASDFLYAVDVSRARSTGVSPKPAPMSPNAAASGNPRFGSVRLSETPSAPPSGAEWLAPADRKAKTAFELYRRDLLNLTRNNKLLDCQPRSDVIPIGERDLTSVLAGLLSDMGFKSSPAEASRGSVTEAPASPFAVVGPPASETAPTYLEVSAGTTFGRSGTKLLSAALGFVLFSLPGTPGQVLKIPLILKPLRVQRGEDGTGARLIGLEEPPRLNPYLIELLDRRFDIDLSPIDVDLERVVRADGLGQVLKRIRTRLARTSSLEVIEEAVVSSFDLSSFDLWRDLEGVSAMAADNPLLHSLMAHAETSARDPTPPHDAERDRSAPLFPPPLPADSSQAHAIAATYAGENFVLAASPGTGRTRTIANMIATTIGAGRTVLFVGRPEALRGGVRQARAGRFVQFLPVARVLSYGPRKPCPPSGAYATARRRHQPHHDAVAGRQAQ